MGSLVLSTLECDARMPRFNAQVSPVLILLILSIYFFLSIYFSVFNIYKKRIIIKKRMELERGQNSVCMLSRRTSM